MYVLTCPKYLTICACLSVDKMNTYLVTEEQSLAVPFEKSSGSYVWKYFWQEKRHARCLLLVAKTLYAMVVTGYNLTCREGTHVRPNQRWRMNAANTQKGISKTSAATRSKPCHSCLLVTTEITKIWWKGPVTEAFVRHNKPELMQHRNDDSGDIMCSHAIRDCYHFMPPPQTQCLCTVKHHQL